MSCVTFFSVPVLCCLPLKKSLMNRSLRIAFSVCDSPNLGEYNCNRDVYFILICSFSFASGWFTIGYEIEYSSILFIQSFFPSLHWFTFKTQSPHSLPDSLTTSQFPSQTPLPARYTPRLPQRESLRLAAGPGPRRYPARCI